VQSGAGCQGGGSGDGSGGNGGPGGPGGLSLGVGYSGTPPPAVDPATMTTVGSAGLGGPPGAAGHGINNAPLGAAGAKSTDGVTQTTPLAL